jgi:hypothetical protein
MGEGVVVRGNHPAIGEMNVSTFNSFDFDQFTVGEAPASISP